MADNVHGRYTSRRTDKVRTELQKRWIRFDESTTQDDNVWSEYISLSDKYNNYWYNL